MRLEMHTSVPEALVQLVGKYVRSCTKQSGRNVLEYSAHKIIGILLNCHLTVRLDTADGPMDLAALPATRVDTVAIFCFLPAR